MGKNQNDLIKGTSWTSLSFAVVTIVYLLRISILTRFLDKADFGIIALALFILGFTNIFSDLGMSTVILSQKKMTKKEYSSLYWMGFLLSVVLYLVLLFISPIFARFYQYEVLEILIPVIGIDLIISTLGRQYNTYLQKDLKFKKIAIIKIVAEVSSLLLALVLAFSGFGIWSLVFSFLLASCLNSFLSIIFTYKQYPLAFCLNLREIKPFYIIGLYQTGSQILDYISSQIDVLILGKILPISEMGVYSIIKTLITRIYSSVNQIFTKVTIPLLAKIQFDQDLLKERYLSIIRLIAICNSFFYMVVILNNKLFLNILYGEKFIEYGFILSILAVWGYFSSLINCAASIIVATGRTKVGFLWTQVRIILNPFFIFLGAYFGNIEGVVLFQAAYSFLVIALYHKVVVKSIFLNISLKEFIKSFMNVVIFSMIIFLFWSVIGYFSIDYFNEIIILIISVIFITISYYLYYKQIILEIIKEFK